MSKLGRSFARHRFADFFMRLSQSRTATTAAVLFGAAGLVAGWIARGELVPPKEGRQRQHGRGGSAVLPVSDGPPPSPDLTAVLGEPSAPTQFFRRGGDGWMAELDGSTRSPRWVAEVLTRESLSAGTGSARGTTFHEEAAIPPHMRARLTDYHGSGWDRGHLAPAADHKGDTGTFFTSNLVPQDPALNRGYWAQLEAWTRELTNEWEAVHVLTGPLYLPTPQGGGWAYSHSALGEAGAWLPVPTHLFKVLLVRRVRGGAVTTAAAAFVLPNAPIAPGTPLVDFLVPLTSVEALSGLQLYREGLGGEAGIAAADAGLGTALGLSGDGPSAHAALALHVARALGPHRVPSDAVEPLKRGKKRNEAPWPPFLGVPSPVAGGRKGGAPIAWHLCALAPCRLPAEAPTQ
jgi:endonuclease G